MSRGTRMTRKCVLITFLLIPCVSLCCLAVFWISLTFNDVKIRSSGVNVFKCNMRVTSASTKKKVNSVDFIDEMNQLNKAKVAADNERLVELIRDYYIDPPSTEPYNLEFPGNIDSSLGQAPIVDSRLQYKECGFYVESGAFDGETLSNTLFFEQRRDWMGILIEPNPVQYKKLVKKHRKAFSINACLSTELYPSEKFLVDTEAESRIFENKQTQIKRASQSIYSVQCFPLYSILLALNRTYIDYLSLDVEGAEKGVLGTIPWSKVNIQMMTIEYNKYPGGTSSLCKDIRRWGYECMVTLSGEFVADVIVKKKKRTRSKQSFFIGRDKEQRGS